MTIGDVCNMKKEEIESLYALAYNLYTSKSYKAAETVFQALCLYNHKDVRFWMGLGGSRQANGNLSGAVDAYAMAGTAGMLKDPEPFLYAVQCYIKLGDKENAIGAIKGMLEIGDPNNPAHAQCHARGRALLGLLEK
jgi:type III secretion system low calcium response chaperone LcrH/SycD